MARPPLHAQMPGWRDRAFINVNLGWRPSSSPFVETSACGDYDEHAAVHYYHHRVRPGAGRSRRRRPPRGTSRRRRAYTLFNNTEMATVSALVRTRFASTSPGGWRAPYFLGIGVS